MPKKGDDWSGVVGGIIGAAAGAGLTAATLNRQIRSLQAQLAQWQRHAAQMQSERDQQMQRANVAELQARQLKESEARLRSDLASMKRRVEELEAKK
jgi:ubiquinone biosynthesis protein UbiJ